MGTFLLTLSALVLPYVVILLLVVAGMLRAPRPTAQPSAPQAEEPAGRAWPSVDVVLPAHNEGRTLPPTLASLHALDYPGRLRIIVVDDRSTDHTAALVEAAAAADPRIRLVQVTEASKRWSPKVNAVAKGLAAGDGEIILTTDADCRLPKSWVTAMTSPFQDPQVVLVLGLVTTRGEGEASGFRERFEAIDWLSLMLASRSLTAFGWSFASSANNQAYRRDAFERAGGFGVAGRAPSGDEDLLAQRLGRLPGARTVFQADPMAAVLTSPTPSWRALLRQRRRWVSRYHHLVQYPPLFWLGVALLGAQSVALSLALLATLLFPALLPGVLSLWAVKLAVELFGFHLGLAQLGRRDLAGWPVLGWALLHPFFIAAAVLGSLFKPSSWRAGQGGYRRRLWRARRQLLQRQLARAGLTRTTSGPVAVSRRPGGRLTP